MTSAWAAKNSLHDPYRPGTAWFSRMMRVAREICDSSSANVKNSGASILVPSMRYDFPANVHPGARLRNVSIQDIIAQFRSGFLGAGIGPTAIARRAAAAAAADWWAVLGQTCVAAYRPIGAADLATSYVNLANPGTYNAAPGVAPGLSAGGWTFNGSSQYLTTGIVPAATYSVIIRYSNAPSLTRALLGADTGGQGQFSLLVSVTDSMYFVHGASTQYIFSDSVAGVIAMSPVAGYWNGAPVKSYTSTLGTLTHALYVGALNNRGIASSFTSATIAAVAIYSTTLSAADVAALTTRMAALA